MKIVSAAEMREIDRATSERFGVPSLAECHVQEQAVLEGRDEQPQNLFQQHRFMDDHRVILPPSSSAASLNLASFSER